MMCEWRLVRGVVSIRSYLSHMTDKGLKNGTDYDMDIGAWGCDPVVIWGVGGGPGLG